MLKQYADRQSMISHHMMSVELVAEVEEASEMDEYSLDGCTFLTTQHIDLYTEISISNELSPKYIVQYDTTLSY